MKKSFLLVLFLSGIITANAQINIGNVLGGGSGQNLGQGLSNDKIVKGLKEALTRGTNLSAEQLAKVDGYYRNPKVKIPWPAEAKQMEKTLRSIGMSKEVESFVRTMNRAAEDAAKKAVPIFVNAITRMTVSDGLNILRGGSSAATEFLKSGTSQALTAEFKPVIKSSLQKVQITRYWSPLVKTYNKMPMTKRVNPDLDAYVTQKAIDGLFKLIAEEEAKIRANPIATGSSLLNEVFGGK